LIYDGVRHDRVWYDFTMIGIKCDFINKLRKKKEKNEKKMYATQWKQVKHNYHENNRI